MLTWCLIDVLLSASPTVLHAVAAALDDALLDI
jgi:hypothetical protein